MMPLLDGEYPLKVESSSIDRKSTRLNSSHVRISYLISFPTRRSSDLGTDALGRKFDYSNGKWMHSWKEWDLKEPTEGLYQLVRAVQLATRKNAMLDDAAARWGVPVKGGEFQYRSEEHTFELQSRPHLVSNLFPYTTLFRSWYRCFR